MASSLFQSLAVVALALHLAWILWVIFGCLVTRNRPLLRLLHVFSLFWGILMELTPLPCPLTIAEQWFQRQAGIAAYTEPFLMHYLRVLVYPNISQSILIWSGVAVSAFNLGVYGVRFRKRRNTGW